LNRKNDDGTRNSRGLIEVMGPVPMEMLIGRPERNPFIISSPYDYYSGPPRPNHRFPLGFKGCNPMSCIRECPRGTLEMEIGVV